MPVATAAAFGDVTAVLVLLLLVGALLWCCMVWYATTYPAAVAGREDGSRSRSNWTTALKRLAALFQCCARTNVTSRHVCKTTGIVYTCAKEQTSENISFPLFLLFFFQSFLSSFFSNSGPSLVLVLTLQVRLILEQFCWLSWPRSTRSCRKKKSSKISCPFSILTQ